MLNLLYKKQFYNDIEYTLKETLEEYISELEFKYQLSISDLIEILKLVKNKYNSDTEKIELDERN